MLRMIMLDQDIHLLDQISSMALYFPCDLLHINKLSGLSIAQETEFTSELICLFYRILILLRGVEMTNKTTSYIVCN